MKHAIQSKKTHHFAGWLAVFALGVLPIACSAKVSSSPVQKKVETKKEIAKEKVHEVIESFDKEKIDETIDSIADSFDTDQLKEKVDEVASYFDKEKIKEFIDLAAEYLNKERIKEMIDLVAEQLDRDKIKQFVDEIAQSIDKEKIEKTADRAIDKIASSLQNFTEELEKQVVSAKGNVRQLQSFLEKKNYSTLISDKVSWGPATLSGLKLNGQKKALVVKPGEQIQGEVLCSLNREDCSLLSMYRVVLGLKHRQGQATIFNHLGMRAGKETDRFVLVAPKQKGVYEIAFRVVQAVRETTALKTWDDFEINGEEEPAVIGLLIVA